MTALMTHKAGLAVPALKDGNPQSCGFDFIILICKKGGRRDAPLFCYFPQKLRLPRLNAKDI